MFALNASEIAWLVLWAIGVAAAIEASRRLESTRQGLGVVVASALLPVVGSVLALAVLAAVVRRDQRRRHIEAQR